MKSRKLSNSLRRTIIWTILKDESLPIIKKMKKMKEEEYVLAEECRVYALGGEGILAAITRDERAIKARLKKYPERTAEFGFIRKCTIGIVTSTGFKVQLLYGEDWCKRVTPNYPWCSVHLDKALDKKVRDFIIHRDKVRTEQEEFKDALYALLQSVNTTKQLVDRYPEYEKYLDKEQQTVTVNTLPGRTVEYLREQLGVGK